MNKLLLVFCFFALHVTPAYSQDESAQESVENLQEKENMVVITPNDLIKLSVVNMKSHIQRRREGVSFQRDYWEHELDRSGKFKSVLKHETTHHGEAYSEDVRVSENNTGFFIDLNKILLLSYDYVLLNPDYPEDAIILDLYPYNCAICYALRFIPKETLPNIEEIVPPGADLMEIGIYETAMRMDGVIYIDREHLFIRKHTGRLSQSFSKYGSAVKITMASIDTEQKLKPELDNMIVLVSGEIRYQARKAWGFWGFETRRKIWQYFNYQLNPQP